jgi:hypothetical protein
MARRGRGEDVELVRGGDVARSSSVAASQAGVDAVATKLGVGKAAAQASVDRAASELVRGMVEAP